MALANTDLCIPRDTQLDLEAKRRVMEAPALGPTCRRVLFLLSLVPASVNDFDVF